MIWRVTKRQTFLDLKRKGKKVRHGSVSMIFVPFETKYPQVAFALTKRFGNAVKRNKARRKLKSAFGVAFNDSSKIFGAYLISASPKILNAPHSKIIDDLKICFNMMNEGK